MGFYTSIEKPVLMRPGSRRFMFSIEGYMGYHIYRSDKIGGGVSVYVRKHIQSLCLCLAGIVG